MNDSSRNRLTDVQGVVKWFDPKKGHGFIVGPEGQDVFVHYSKIVGDGFRVLKDGSTVSYDAELTDRGWHATRVVRSEEFEVTVPGRGHRKARPPRMHGEVAADTPPSLVLTIELPEDATDEEVERAVGDLVVAASARHQKFGGYGLKIDSMSIGSSADADVDPDPIDAGSVVPSRGPARKGRR